jgi:DNA-binding IscR family transcriptional regulator
MKRNDPFSMVLHLLMHMAERDVPTTSGELAACLETNPVVVRRTLAGLREAGIVVSDRGHGGGWKLGHKPAAITLQDVHRALGEPALLGLGARTESPGCLVEQAVNGAIDEVMAEAHALLAKRFAAITLADLARGRALQLASRYDTKRRKTSHAT